MDPNTKEKNVVLGRGIFRETVNFFKKEICKEYFKGRVETTMFKGFTSKDEEFKKEVEAAIKAMRDSKTGDYESRKQKVILENSRLNKKKQKELEREFRDRAMNMPQEECHSLTSEYLINQALYHYNKWSKEKFLSNKAISFIF